MTTKRIVYTNSGKCSIVIPALNFVQNLMNGGMTELQAIEFIKNKDVPVGASGFIVEASSIPIDRYFRDAWVVDSSGVNVDLFMARSIKKNKILKAYDIKYNEYILRINKAEDKNDNQEINRLKQNRKDLTTEIENLDNILSGINDVRSLQNYIPNGLSGVII